MSKVFTTSEVESYLDERIYSIERRALAYQQIYLRVVEEGGAPTQSLDFDSIEDIHNETESATVTVKYTEKQSALREVFVFQNPDDEELGQKIIDAFIEAGLPESDQSIFDVMSKLEQDFKTLGGTDHVES